ncbi:MAG: alpha-ribazole phosphatase [Patescibacteria group bacterium]|nr:alpha-ribazole phosphatase [Patescibacteria group bacterium]
MTRIYLVRHGDAYGLDGLQLDNYPLNNQGKIQALQLARRLKENKFNSMYCSRLQRAMETCQIVNEDHQMPVIYTSALNEVGNEDWPRPGQPTPVAGIKDLKENADRIYELFHRFTRRHLNEEIILFTHGNLIRSLLMRILGEASPTTFTHFVIHNTSLTIIDVDDTGFEHIISVSDAAHTRLYDTKI